ncbi:hypothetical protein [Rubrivirga sp.]|uniref:hypothetical protein n=1 Tax=Rubrivirga sp. TaxID=1885344 RepID=UPI003C7722AC
MPETDPSITPVCPRCGSDAMIPDAFVTAEGYGGVTLNVGLFVNPKAMMMKRPVQSKLSVSVCGDCGHVEAEVVEPRKLWDAYIERLSREMDR